MEKKSSFDTNLIMLYNLNINKDVSINGSRFVAGALDRDDLYRHGISIDDRHTLFNGSIVVHSLTSGPV